MKLAPPMLTGLGGVVLGGAVSVVYAMRGFHRTMPYVLGVAIVVIALSLRGSTRTRTAPAISRADVLATALLLLVFVPLYTYRVYTTPWQVNTDEITLISISRILLHAPPGDLFGITNYFGCPAAAFLVFGLMGQLLGGIDLYHLRLAHGILGVASVVAAYVLFRQFMRPLVAVASALILGVNHSMVAYSRMAMWPNSTLLLEIVALIFLARGLQRQSLRSLFVSGIASGLAFYFYFPGRITIAICVFVLIAAWVLDRQRRGWQSLVKSLAVISLGWALVAPPVIIATAKNPALGLQYQREQLLIYPEGRKAAEYWTRTTSPRAAWMANIRNGLATFNSRTPDHGWLYPNPGNGFADPVTGILLWTGFLVALIRVVRYRSRHSSEAAGMREAIVGDLIALTGFLALFLMLAFVVTKAPNYQRLLLILPFAAYLAGTGLWSILDALERQARRISARLDRLRPFAVTGIAVVALIGVLNLEAFRKFADLGQMMGHEVGSTGRFVEARKHEKGHAWVLAADKDNLYYFWGEPWWWQGWLGFFAGSGQTVKVVPLSALESLPTPGRTTVFVSRAAWVRHARAFRSGHVVNSVTNVVPTGLLVAVEVEGPR